MRFIHGLLALLLAAVLGLSSSHAQEATAGVSDARLARLARGINLPFWVFSTEWTEDFTHRFIDEDFQLLHDLGFTYVRLPVDLAFVLDTSQPDLLKAQGVAYVDEAIDHLLAHGLGVMVDLHALTVNDSGLTLIELENNPALTDQLVNFWRSFAGHLSVRDPEWVFLEPLNEPGFYENPAEWLAIQDRLLATMREAAPEQTLVVTAPAASSLDELIKLVPAADPNVVYNFHFYEPFYFTHQGAEWSTEIVVPLRNVPYPANPQNVQLAIDQLTDADLQARLRQYGAEQWDNRRIKARLGQVAAWAKAYQVRVICNEFGVYKNYAPPADRAQWLDDVRTTLEGLGIGWAMWEYSTEFGLVVRDAATQTLKVDEAVAQALGLNPGP